MVVCLTVVVCFPTATAKDVSNAQITVVDHSERISASQIAEIKDPAGAYIVMEDGAEVSIPSVVTIEDVSANDVSAFSLSPENLYVVSVEAAASEPQTTSDSSDQNFCGIHVSAKLL